MTCKRFVYERVIKTDYRTIPPTETSHAVRYRDVHGEGCDKNCTPIETPWPAGEPWTGGAEGATMPDKGDYVLATKYNDGDPGDNWAVGFYDREENGRHFVVDGDGNQLRHSGYRRVGRITSEYGNWLLGVAAKVLEQSPPGTVNLWTMATDRARGVDPHAETSEPDSKPPQPLDGTAKLT